MRPASHRRDYIDWARGIAVLLMIEAHTIDSWTRPESKTSVAYSMAMIFGGFAAPLFLWLAGLGTAMAASRTAERTGNRAQAVEATFRRGLEVFVLAFLFRLQAFIVSPPSPPLKIFRVDILNVMGPAMAAAALVWAVGNTSRMRACVYGGIAMSIAMITPIMRVWSTVDRLPVWLQWYVRPAGEFTTFTLFPWAGFVFAGAAVGALVAEARQVRVERRLHAGLAVAGIVLAAMGFAFATRPSIYQSSAFWTTSPTWFAIRIGIVMVGLAACFAIEQFEFAWLAPLAKMGRSSLFVYWIHVELVYGYASWLWRGRLPFWGTLIGFAVFSALMYGAVLLRDRVVDNWRRISRVADRGLRIAD